MSEDKSIKETLDVIRRALEDEDSNNVDKNILILNRRVNKDGTINVIKDKDITKDEVRKILDEKIQYIFEKYFDQWLEKKLPAYIDKYLQKK